MDDVAPGPLRGGVLLALASHFLTGDLRTPTLRARAARMRVVELLGRARSVCAGASGHAGA
jgi:hypothetical protein